MYSIAILHPDLGIGGAERLIVDCALALKESGHSIGVFTSHHDKNHCFKETKNGELNVITAGDWIPRSTFGIMKAFWAYIRMIYLTIYFILYYNHFELVICDQISSGIPLLKAFRIKCLFYCHFPDQLLTKRESLIKKIYRYPIDKFEEWTIGLSDVILVNSHFTDEMFHKTFKSLSNVITKVLYPSVPFEEFDKKITGTLDIKLNNVNTIYLSINRYERKKNLSLAIDAMKILCDSLAENQRKSVHLIIAGGYDLENQENLEYFEELNEIRSKLNMDDYVTFLKNLSDEQKRLLLHSCTAVIYTPENEHFGIVPLEAMYMKRPVIASNSGGPKETIIDNETGFLCEPFPNSFAEAMIKFFKDKSLSREMGLKGHQHVIEKFNYKTFKYEINKIVTDLIKNQ